MSVLQYYFWLVLYIFAGILFITIIGIPRAGNIFKLMELLYAIFRPTVL